MKVSDIISACAAHYHVQTEDVMAQNRHKYVSEARHVAMYLARTHTGLSYPELGREFNNRDHTTVLHAVQRITKRVDDGDEPLFQNITAIRRALPGSDPKQGLELLAHVLRRMRWDDQGGYPGYQGDGKWDFVRAGLPQVTPEELNGLMELAGIEPDIIQPLGDCNGCAHSVPLGVGRGRGERGYKQPCLGCKRPRMSNFKPIQRPKRLTGE